MIAIVLSLALAQSAPSRADVIGALNVMQTAVVAARAGTRTVTRTATRGCIAPAAGVLPGSKTVRFGVAMISAAAARAFFQGATDTEDSQVGIEVQAPPADVPTFTRALTVNLDVIESEIEVRASPIAPVCEVAIVRLTDSARPFRCACAIDATCKLTDGSTAPLGMTLGADTFTPGTGCRAKPCVTRFDTVNGVPVDRSWPAECPK